MKLGQVDLYRSLIVLAIYPKRKLGQVDLINISAEDLPFGWTQLYYFQGGQYSLTQSVTLHTSLQMTMDHMDPLTGVTNKSLNPCIHVVILLTLEIVFDH